MNTTQFHRFLVVALSCALLVAGCGGDGGESEVDQTSATTVATQTTVDSGATDETTTTSATTTSATPADTSDDGGSTSGLDENKAVVTIGDGQYEFDVEMSIVGRCDPDFFGAFWVIAGAADGSNSGLEMFIVPEGNTNHDETSKIKVNLKEAEGRDWRADEDGGEGTPEGESRVESFTIDGNTVSGTASFVDIYAGDGATAQGTFEVTCPAA